MKKIIIPLIFILFFAVPVSAHDMEENYVLQINDITDEYGLDFEQLKDYPLETLWQTVKNSIIKSLNAPLKTFYSITAITLITAFINFFAEDTKGKISRIINTVSVLLLFYLTGEAFSAMITTVSAALFDIKNFIATFIPVFAGISFAAGEITASAVYTGFFLISVTFIADFCIAYILPSVNLFLAVGITSQLSSVVKLKPLCDIYSKTVKILMTAAVSVLCFVLSLQTVISQGKDGLMLKAGKLFMTSTVPIIGSSLENAVGSIYASMGVLKSFCGLAGIGAIISIFLPHIVTLSVNWIGYQFMIALSEILENKSVSGLLSCFKDIIEILLSMCVLFAVLLIFSLTIMIQTVGIG